VSSTPEAPLQFDCPACGAVLTVPAAIAGMQGPCPKCWQEIISPDPAIGMPARLPALPAATAPEPEPIAPPAPELVASSTPAPVEPPTPEPLAPPEPEPVLAPVAEAPPPEPLPTPAPLPPEPAKASEIPSADKLDEIPPPPAPRPRSKARLLLALGIPALALAAVGYYFGKDHLPPVYQSSILGLSSNQPPAVERVPAPAPAPDPVRETGPAPAPTPDETGQGLPPPRPEASQENDAQQALEAFLSAPDWQARGAFVLSPDEIRPEMEKYAEKNGDGPIPASAIQLLEAAPPNLIFKVCTKAMPDGFPVAVALTDEGPKIDWEAFIAFNDDHFRKLLVGPADQSGILNLLVKPETGAEPSPHWIRYRLSVPMPDREATAWVRKESVAMARLKSIFDGENGLDKETVDKLVAETGIPLRLAITKRRTNDGREFIEVVDMVAIGWAPAKKQP